MKNNRNAALTRIYGIFSIHLFLFFFPHLSVSSVSPEADSNQWLKQSLTAARKKKCQEFYCLQRPGTDDFEDDDITAKKKDEEFHQH